MADLTDLDALSALGLPIEQGERVMFHASFGDPGAIVLTDQALLLRNPWILRGTRGQFRRLPLGSIDAVTVTIRPTRRSRVLLGWLGLAFTTVALAMWGFGIHSFTKPELALVVSLLAGSGVLAAERAPRVIVKMTGHNIAESWELEGGAEGEVGPDAPMEFARVLEEVGVDVRVERIPKRG